MMMRPGALFLWAIQTLDPPLECAPTSFLQHGLGVYHFHPCTQAGLVALTSQVDYLAPRLDLNTLEPNLYSIRINHCSLRVDSLVCQAHLEPQNSPHSCISKGFSKLRLHSFNNNIHQ